MFSFYLLLVITDIFQLQRPQCVDLNYDDEVKLLTLFLYSSTFRAKLKYNDVYVYIFHMQSMSNTFNPC